MTSDEVQEALSRPGRAGGRRRRVEVRETHISWVFLAADRAYKLKKPLVLPFLDYRTAQRRREMCCEEVRLNRRLAPGLYLGVRSLVAQGDGRLMMADAEVPGAIDYLVEMRRYDERTTLSAALARGELTRPHVRAIARVIARFHAQAPSVRPCGLPVLSAERQLTANFHELLAIIEQRAEIDRVLALERFMHAFVVAHAQLFDRRARSGLVREVHGDLRAEHVLVGRPIRIVDCIEFDPALRQLDVADDLAFLVMDMSARGAGPLAWDLVQAYRRAGGDAGEDWLLAFYGAYRALVRAKVALLRAAQHPPESSAHGRESAAARDLLALAERFSWRARRPLIIVVCGLPAAGKSLLATALAELSELPHVSADVTRKRLAGVAPSRRAPDEVYRPEFNRRTYSELGRRAAREVRSLGGAIVDATFRHAEDRAAFAEALAGAAPVLFVECLAPASTLIERALARQSDPGMSDASAAVVEHELSSWQPLDEVPAQTHLITRSDRRVEEQLSDLLAWLDRRV